VLIIPGINPSEYVDEVKVLNIPCHKITGIIDQLEILASQPKKNDPHRILNAQPSKAGPSIAMYGGW